MPLTPGTRLGPYEILAPLGSGGMGEVYRARDPRMGRDVAIKVSAARFSDRFEREVHAVAALNYPNISQIYDVGPNYLVMELVEGPTLAERIAAGPIPLDEALRIAHQIADALEAAHEKGIVHRDLKPGNIKIKADGVVKVLDFGLAKLAEPVAVGQDEATLTVQEATRAGVILGTAGYMSPEQARGMTVDKRSDIWAFGVVLYEMLSGRRLFHGESMTDTLAAVLTKEPGWNRVPAKARPLLQSCLEKDPKRRLRDIGDVSWLLADSPAEGPRPQDRGKLAWIAAAAIAILVTVGLSFVHFREKPPKASTIRFTVSLPETVQEMDFPAISPDGERLVFSGVSTDGKRRLWIRPLDSLTARPLAGSEDASLPFWSPDSRNVAFFAGGKLKKIDLQGGSPLTLCDARVGRPGAWNRDGVILFTPGLSQPLYQVSAAGGEARPATALDSSRQELSHRWAHFLPDGRHFIYFSQSTQAPNSGIYAGSLDSKETKRLVLTSANAVYTTPPPGAAGLGYLLFMRTDTLMAQPFDARKLELSGEPFPVAEQVLGGGFAFSASENGALAYRTGTVGAAELVWLDRSGKRLGTVGEPADYSNPAIAPDEKKLAISQADLQTKTRDIWLFDLVRGTSSRFTFDPADDTNPVWSPDGGRIAFTSDRKGHRDIYQKAATGTGEDEPMLQSADEKSALDWSHDGKLIVFDTGVLGSRGSIVEMFPLNGDRKPSVVVQGPAAREDQAQISPNDRWIAYRSSESRRDEVFVQSFPPSGGKWQVSTNGGQEPRWRQDGKELYYLARDKLMAVEVKTDSSVFEAGIPKPLFEFRASSARRNHYVVAANGQRFLVVTPVQQAASITVIANWLTAAKK